jgi:hypothetical protein
LPIHPLTVASVDVENLRWNRWNLPTFSYGFHTLEELLVLDFRNVLGEVFAGFEDKCIQVHERADAIRHAVGHAADHTAAIRMAAQDNVRQFLPAHQILDVENMCVQIHLPRREM